MYTVEESTWSGVPVLQLKDEAADTVALLAPSLGANLFSLTVGGKELLRRPPDAEALQSTPTRWGIPVLLPPGRITNGRFEFEGRQYQFEVRPDTGHHIHGFVLKRVWEVGATSTGEEGARVELVFDAGKHPDVLSQFPHPFVFTIRYTLKGSTLQCESFIANPGAEAMPFGLGYHHYFWAPPEGAGDWAIRLPGAQKQWVLSDGIPTGQFVQPEGGENLEDWQEAHSFWRDAGYSVTEAESDGWTRAYLLNRTTGDLITLAAGPEYGHWVIFNGRPGFEGFVCLEPYTCMPNAFNLDLPRSVTGMGVVAPGEGRAAGTWNLQWALNRS